MSFNNLNTKKMLEIAGVDISKGKAKLLCESTDEIKAEYDRLKKDKGYMNDLISDMLSAEGKPDTEANRKNALHSASGKYLMDIARDNIKK